MVHCISNGSTLCKINFTLSIRNNLILSIIILCLVPIIHGISYLNEVFSAQCMEGFVIIPGIVLLVPLLQPEHSREISEIVSSKVVSQRKIILSRIFIAVICLAVLFFSFAGIMKAFKCDFPYIKYAFGTFCSAIALGSTGLFASAVSGSTIIGYLVSISYFLFDKFTHGEYLSVFTLSSMQSGSFTEKYYILGLGILLSAAAVLKKRD